MLHVHSLLLSTYLLAGLKTHLVSGYSYSTGPIPRNKPHKPNTRRNNCSSNTAFPNTESSIRCDVNQKSVDRAFRELEKELEDLQQSKDDHIFDWMTSMTTATMDGGQAKDIFENIDTKTAKKWIEKAFDLASEFNQDFTNVQGEKDATDEILRKSRDWVAGLYEEEGDNEDDVEESEHQSTDCHDESNKRSCSDQSDTSSVSPDRDSDETEKKTAKIAPEIPDSENRSNEKVFEASVDLPGVDRTDVDISVEDDCLLVRAERKTGSRGGKDRVYSIEIPFPENEVDSDKLEASFKNGVLVISAPKLKPRKEKKRKIPIM